MVGIGGTTRPNSSCEKALRCALDAVERRGARTILLGTADLDLPNYAPERPERSPSAQRPVSEIPRANGLIISSPGYHGGISGFIKNAIDYVEDLRTNLKAALMLADKIAAIDPRYYVDGRSSMTYRHIRRRFRESGKPRHAIRRDAGHVESFDANFEH